MKRTKAMPAPKKTYQLSWKLLVAISQITQIKKTRMPTDEGDFMKDQFILRFFFFSVYRNIFLVLQKPTVEDSREREFRTGTEILKRTSDFPPVLFLYFRYWNIYCVFLHEFFFFSKMATLFSFHSSFFFFSGPTKHVGVLSR